MCSKLFSIACALHNYDPNVKILVQGDENSAEFGGELPRVMVDSLKASGAEVLRYSQRGVVSTVVRF